MIDSKEIFILGIGATSPVFMELALDCGYRIAGLYHYNDERTGSFVHGYEIIGSFNDLFLTDITGKQFLLGMGDMHIRKELSHKIEARGGVIPTIIHPSAIVSRFADISKKGVLVLPMCLIHSDVKIAEGVVIHDKAMVCHTTSIAPYVFVGPRAMIGANLKIEELAFVGQGALVISTKATPIGTECVIGAGSVVTKAVEPFTIVAGNPAKRLLDGKKGEI